MGVGRRRVSGGGRRSVWAARGRGFQGGYGRLVWDGIERPPQDGRKTRVDGGKGEAGKQEDGTRTTVMRAGDGCLNCAAQPLALNPRPVRLECLESATYLGTWVPCTEVV